MAQIPALAATGVLWRGIVAGRAGSQRISPGWRRVMRRRPGLAPTGEGLDDDHMATAAWARRTGVGRLFWHVVIGRCCDGEEFAGTREAGLARRTREQAIVTD